jgi:phasin family protein
MANPTNPFGDLTDVLEQFKLPGVDMTAIFDARRKDIEALIEANKAAYASMQALAKKQTEMLTQAMQGIQEAAQAALSSAGDPVRQAELGRMACEKTLTDMKDLADMVRQSQADTMASITQRAAERMQEVRRLIAPK